MLTEGKIFVGKSVKPEYLDLKLANRHGLITGATGTGKTVSLQVLAEGFSDAGVPVFAADIKGDLSGIAAEGTQKDFIDKRLVEVGLPPFTPRAYPTVLWDVFGEQGHPIRATVSDMGPLLLSRLLELNETQEGVLTILFRVFWPPTSSSRNRASTRRSCSGCSPASGTNCPRSAIQRSPSSCSSSTRPTSSSTKPPRR